MQKYAIIDIETTGANRGGNKITEIAILVTDGNKIIDEYETLLNPERNIPTNITYLTGITNEMVMDKPRFFEVAKKIVEITQDCIFVAHNVFFDYNFIRSEFNELGFSYNRQKLCTVRLSRKAFPGLKSYSLGNLTKHFNIPLRNHHRAMADATATFELFKLIKKANPLILEQPLAQKRLPTTLPPELDTKYLDNLPEAAGIYYFYSSEGELLYIGKSKNIRRRILNHFRPDIKRKKDLQLKHKIAHIETKITGNELAALLLESHEIKHFKPPFNTALKTTVFKYHVVLNTKSEIPELKVSTQADSSENPFKSKAQANRSIEKYIKRIFGIADHEFLESSLKKYYKILGAEIFKQKLCGFFDQFQYPESDFWVELKGRTGAEKCAIEVKEGKLERMVFYKEGEEEVIPLLENRDHRLILLGYINKYKLRLRKS